MEMGANPLVSPIVPAPVVPDMPPVVNIEGADEDLPAAAVENPEEEEEQPA